VLRTYGVQGCQAHIRAGVALAHQFAALVAAHPLFELVLPVTLSLVCFRLRAEGEAGRGGAAGGGGAVVDVEALNRRNKKLLDDCNDRSGLGMQCARLSRPPGSLTSRKAKAKAPLRRSPTLPLTRPLSLSLSHTHTHTDCCPGPCPWPRRARRLW
jgi:hypothetical protein